MTGESPSRVDPGAGTSPRDDRLFTPRFFVMCLFTFTVFLSAFQLFPTAPFRMMDLGGTKFTAGLFLGFLTYASALSAPVTGGLADRLGRRRMLLICSVAQIIFAAGYGVSTNVEVPLVLVVFHGIFWSGLLSASSAYISDIIPPHRRAEGIGYWGMSSILAIAAAPPLGLWIYGFGWGWVCASIALLNVLMACVAFVLPEPVRQFPATPTLPRFRDLIEWRVLGLSGALFLYAVGHGGITSFAAVYARAQGIHPAGLFFTVMAVVILVTRPFSGVLADRIGHRRIILPCLGLIFLGMLLLAAGSSATMLVIAAAVYGAGVGNTYPAYSAYVVQHVPDDRRGAACGICHPVLCCCGAETGFYL
jgi:MFS family permease